MMLETYAGLFAWSFGAATVLPLASEVPLALLVRAQGTLWLPVAIATAGNYLGSCTTYWVARGAFVAWRRKRPLAQEPSRSQQRARTIMAKWGPLALVLSWVPVLGDALVVAAGVGRVPFKTASAWLILGKFLRYLLVAWLALRTQ